MHLIEAFACSVVDSLVFNDVLAKLNLFFCLYYGPFSHDAANVVICTFNIPYIP